MLGFAEVTEEGTPKQRADGEEEIHTQEERNHALLLQHQVQALKGNIQ